MTWTTQLVLSQRRDQVVELGPGVEPFYTTLNTGFSGLDNLRASGARVAPGYPLGGWWSLPVVGYSDMNGNGAIEPGEIVLGDTAVYRARRSPTIPLRCTPRFPSGGAPCR